MRTFKSNHTDNYPLVLKSEQTGVKTHVSATCQHLQWVVPAFLVIPYPHGAFPGGPELESQTFKLLNCQLPLAPRSRAPKRVTATH